jgi:hypothetical protein
VQKPINGLDLAPDVELASLFEEIFDGRVLGIAAKYLVCFFLPVESVGRKSTWGIPRPTYLSGL